MAIATDAFLFSWDDMELYTFLPFWAIMGLLSKLRSSRGTSVILIVLFWLSKEWFPDLIQVTVDSLCLLLVLQYLLRQPHSHRFHDGLHMLQLATWKLSRDSFVLRATPGELRCSWRDLDGIQRL